MATKLLTLDTSTGRTSGVSSVGKSYVGLENIENDVFIDNNDPTGWLNPNTIQIDYDYTTRTITLTGDLTYYFQGKKYQLTSPWTSSAHTATQTGWFLYSADGGTFAWSTSPWAFNYLMVAKVVYGASADASYAIRETHGTMPWQVHNTLHSQIGTYRQSGGTLTAGTYTTNTATDVATTPGFDQATVVDEDIQTTIPAVIDGTYTTMYVGVDGVSVFNTASSFPFISSGSFIQVNNTTTGAMTNGTTGRYYNVYQLLVPAAADVNSQKYRMIMVQPQATYTSLALAQAEDPRTLSLGSLGSSASEFILYARITYVTASADANTGKCRIATGGITYLFGNRFTQTSIIGTNSHGALSDLTWSTSGHTGTNNTLAGFDADGVATEVSTIAASQVNVTTSGSPSDAGDVQSVLSHMWSAGILHGGAITIHADTGLADIAACDIAVRTGTTEESSLVVTYDAGVTDLQCPANDVSYIYRDYNNGSPQWSVGTSLSDFNNVDKILAYAVSRNGTRMKAISAIGSNVDTGRKIRSKDTESDGFIYHGFYRSILGRSLISSTNQNIQIGAGKYFWFDNPITHSEFDTSVAGTAEANVIQYFYNRSSWIQIADQKTINNTQYDNAGTLATLGNNKYRTDWLYVVLSSVSAPCLVAIMGNAEYSSLAAAQAAPLPTSVPAPMDGISVLVGQVCIVKDGTTVTVQHAGSTLFSPSVMEGGSSDHTGLTNLAWTSSGHTGTASNIAAFNGSGAADELTATEATAMLNAFTGDSGSGGVKGLVPAPASGDAAAGKYLDSDGTWTVPPTGSASPYTIVSKTAAYTVVAADFGKVLHCSSASFTITLTAAATLGAGFYVDIVNTSDTNTHVITIDPNSTETIDGKTTWLVRRGEGIQIYCDGSNWLAGNRLALRMYADNYAKATTRPIASGNGAIALGSSTASNTDCVAIGSSNTASSTQCVAIGKSSTATQASAVGIGTTAVSAATGSVSIGYQTTCSGNGQSFSTAIGANTTCGHNNSVSIGSSAYNVAQSGKFVFANEHISAIGDAQTGLTIFKGETTGTEAVILLSQGIGGAAADYNILAIPVNTGVAMRGIVIGKRISGTANEAIMFEFSGAATRKDGNVGLVAAITPTKTATSSALTTSTLAIAADTTNQGIKLTVTGVSSITIRWVATVWTSEAVGLV